MEYIESLTERKKIHFLFHSTHPIPRSNKTSFVRNRCFSFRWACGTCEWLRQTSTQTQRQRRNAGLWLRTDREAAKIIVVTVRVSYHNTRLVETYWIIWARSTWLTLLRLPYRSFSFSNVCLYIIYLYISHCTYLITALYYDVEAIKLQIKIKLNQLWDPDIFAKVCHSSFTTLLPRSDRIKGNQLNPFVNSFSFNLLKFEVNKTVCRKGWSWIFENFGNKLFFFCFTYFQ